MVGWVIEVAWILRQREVLVNAEVVGSTTFVGVDRRAWRRGVHGGDPVLTDVVVSTGGG